MALPDSFYQPCASQLLGALDAKGLQMLFLKSDGLWWTRYICPLERADLFFLGSTMIGLEIACYEVTKVQPPCLNSEMDSVAQIMMQSCQKDKPSDRFRLRSFLA